MEQTRIVITGIGLTSPIGNNLKEMRESLLNNKGGLQHIDIRHMGKVPAGLCTFNETLYQTRKMRKRGTRAGAIGIYCAHEAINDAHLNLETIDKDRVGIYLGITEHGNVETENEIHELYQNNLDCSFWSHHHNPRTVANSPAGEVSLNLKITGPAYTLGAACAAGNVGPIHGAQMLRAGEVDIALCGGVSESPHTFGIFAAFTSQGALGNHEDPEKSCRPLDESRNGIAVSEGGAVFVLERLEDAMQRGATIYGEILGYHINSDATDFVLPNAERQVECIQKALKKAKISANEVDIVNMHATGTSAGDIQECKAIKQVFAHSENTFINCTKGFIGHAMGAAGALELAGNIPSFWDEQVHSCKNLENLDAECHIPNLVVKNPKRKNVNIILNNSFGMLGINSTLIIKKYNKN